MSHNTDVENAVFLLDEDVTPPIALFIGGETYERLVGLEFPEHIVGWELPDCEIFDAEIRELTEAANHIRIVAEGDQEYTDWLAFLMVECSVAHFASFRNVLFARNDEPY